MICLIRLIYGWNNVQLRICHGKGLSTRWTVEKKRLQYILLWSPSNTSSPSPLTLWRGCFLISKATVSLTQLKLFSDGSWVANLFLLLISTSFQHDSLVSHGVGGVGRLVVDILYHSLSSTQQTQLYFWGAPQKAPPQDVLKQGASGAAWAKWSVG